MNIEHSNTFRRALKDGINLFLGSGFSVHSKDAKGQPLPVGKELAQELAVKFKLPSALGLSELATILERTNRNEFYSYLQSRFFVEECDIRYMIINKIAVKSIFTTNIDNLVYKIYSNNTTSYLNNIINSGTAFADRNAVDYVPLHGCVCFPDSKFVFNTVDLATAFSHDRDTWHFLRERVQQFPTVFIGYSFSDAGVIQAMYPSGDQQHNTKWIVLKDCDEGSMQYFKALGFNVIQCSSGQFLDYLSNVDLDYDVADIKVAPTKTIFPNECIPEVGSVPVRPLINFYLGEPPIWSDILDNRVYRTSHFESINDFIDSGKNLVVLGTPASGKTTLMMLTAANKKYSGHKLVANALTREKAEFILKALDGNKAIVFVDNIADNIESFNLLVQSPNVQAIGFEREYHYEIVSHKIERDLCNFYNVTDITEQDMQSIFNRIPPEIRKISLRTARNDGDKPSLFEFINLNINKPHINERFTSVIRDLEGKSTDLSDFFMMCCYVHSCRTPVSLDMILAFFRNTISQIQDIYDLKRTLGSMIIDYTGDLIDETQDYFCPRSSILSETVLRRVPPKILKRTIWRFHESVSPFRICRYDIFKRRAYDANLMKYAFIDWEEGKSFYEMVYNRDQSPYLLQQGALYLSYKNKFPQAFTWIDDALLLSKNRIFSIRNSHSIILFSANINGDDSSATVRDTLDRSMQILSECYKNDKRKIYHASTFANQSLQYYGKYHDTVAEDYLETAFKWVSVEAANHAWNYELRELKKSLSLLRNKYL